MTPPMNAGFFGISPAMLAKFCAAMNRLTGQNLSA